jgi:hypothetical protein
MGSGGSGRGYSSVELMHSGWLEPGWLRQTTAPGTFTLVPLYAPISVSGVRVVEYRVSSSLSYVFETRAQGTAVDTSVNNPGVRVYAVTNRDYRNAYMVNPGARYVPASTVLTDSANKLTITVRSSSASGASVAVAAIAAPSPRPSASRSASPSPSPSPTEIPVSPSAEAEPTPIDTEGVITDDIAADRPSRKGNPMYVVIGIGLVLAVALATGTTFLIRGRHRPRHRR